MKKPYLFAIFLLALALTGCANYQPLQLEPAKRGAAVAPKFSQAYYYYDRDRTLYFVMRSESKDQTTGKAITQIATIRVFWHPKGGVTTLNPAALNATFRYVLMTDDAVGMYEGAGFVRLNSKDGKKKFEARVVDGDMRLTQASANFNDTLGRSHIKGIFTATYDDAKTVDMLLEAHREFFARSMLSKPASSAATAPGDWGVIDLAPPSPPGTMPAETLPATP